MFGGSAVGTELGQFLRRFGAQVSIVERSATLLSPEEPRVGELLGERMRADDIDVRTAATVTTAHREATDSVLLLTTAVSCAATWWSWAPGASPAPPNSVWTSAPGRRS